MIPPRLSCVFLLLLISDGWAGGRPVLPHPADEMTTLFAAADRPDDETGASVLLGCNRGHCLSPQETVPAVLTHCLAERRNCLSASTIAALFLLHRFSPQAAASQAREMLSDADAADAVRRGAAQLIAIDGDASVLYGLLADTDAKRLPNDAYALATAGDYSL